MVQTKTICLVLPMDMFVMVMTTVEWCMVMVKRVIEGECVCVCGGGCV